jgi:hypothetical protein
MVAKSFINGVSPIGSIPDRGGVGAMPNWIVSPVTTGLLTATERLQLFSSAVGSLEAFNQNPLTAAKDGKYRVFSRINVGFDCDCNNKLTVTSLSTDMDGGYETAGLRGTMNITGPKVLRLGNSGVSVVWRGWGRPNAFVEPGMQWVAFRTSLNIWHNAEIWLECVEGEGVYTIKSFTGSYFPSHRLWVNGGPAQADIAQRTFSDLWDALPGHPTFVNGPLPFLNA